jgi:hypothetical protein
MSDTLYGDVKKIAIPLLETGLSVGGGLAIAAVLAPEFKRPSNFTVGRKIGGAITSILGCGFAISMAIVSPPENTGCMIFGAIAFACYSAFLFRSAYKQHEAGIYSTPIGPKLYADPRTAQSGAELYLSPEQRAQLDAIKL